MDTALLSPILFPKLKRIRCLSAVLSFPVGDCNSKVLLQRVVGIARFSENSQIIVLWVNNRLSFWVYHEKNVQIFSWIWHGIILWLSVVTAVVVKVDVVAPLLL